MFLSKCFQPIPLSARIHVSKPDAHLLMHQDIHDVVNLTLRPAGFNRRSGSTLGLFLPNVGWLRWKSPLHEFELMHRNNCGCIKLSQAPLVLLLHSKRRISDRKNILFVIVFCLILGINLTPPLCNNCGCIKTSQVPLPLLLHSKRHTTNGKNILLVIVFSVILGISVGTPLLRSLVSGICLAPLLFCSIALLWTAIVGIQLAPLLFCNVALQWMGITLPSCGRRRLRLGQGGHQTSLRGCNKITKCQGPGRCGICHGGYRASTPPLSSSCPQGNMQNASRVFARAGGVARANTTTKATTRMSTIATMAAMSCTQCQGVGRGHKGLCQY